MKAPLWFDVGIVRYTTRSSSQNGSEELWFDVGIVRYTTHLIITRMRVMLWFDVGIVRYTTVWEHVLMKFSCGLM